MAVETSVNLIKAGMSFASMKWLFDRLISNLKSGIKNNDRILLIGLGNPRFYNLCCKYVNPELIYIIEDIRSKFLYYGRNDINRDHIKFIDLSNFEKEVFWHMKFDKIIMNPPYNGNLHLKILAEAIKHLNEDGECVHLGPVRWLQDPLAKYKKRSDLKRFEDPVAKRIESIELIKTEDANKIFKIELLQPLCIYKCNNKNTNEIYADFNTTNLLDKIFSKIIEDNGFAKMTKLQFTDNLKNFVIINKMAPPMKYGRPMFDAVKTWCGPFINGKNSKNETYREAKKNCKASVVGNIEKDICVVFDTDVEVKNCYASLNCKFSRFVTMKSVVDVNVYQQFLPWMGDCINPRTGLKGYESEWTNEDFYTYFNITKEEQELIEKTMEKYK